MQEQMIDRETAILAKKKGFNIISGYYYSGDTIIMGYHVDEISACTQSLLQKWLRDTHKIHIEISMHEFGKWCFAIRLIDSGMEYCPSLAKLNVWDMRDYISYEKALEAGLKFALTLINNNDI